jgi:hypothetical protein
MTGPRNSGSIESSECPSKVGENLMPQSWRARRRWKSLFGSRLNASLSSNILPQAFAVRLRVLTPDAGFLASAQAFPMAFARAPNDKPANWGLLIFDCENLMKADGLRIDVFLLRSALLMRLCSTSFLTSPLLASCAAVLLSIRLSPLLNLGQLLATPPHFSLFVRFLFELDLRADGMLGFFS